MKIIYGGREIPFEQGVISTENNYELHNAVNDWLRRKFGFSLIGGCVEKDKVCISIKAPVATGVEQMGRKLKQAFGIKELVVEGLRIK